MPTMIRQIFKDFIQAIRPYEPGKPIKELERELGVRRAVKLASNENPLGPSGKALRAMRSAIEDETAIENETEEEKPGSWLEW